MYIYIQQGIANREKPIGNIYIDLYIYIYHVSFIYIYIYIYTNRVVYINYIALAIDPFLASAGLAQFVLCNVSQATFACVSNTHCELTDLLHDC